MQEMKPFTLPPLFDLILMPNLEYLNERRLLKTILFIGEIYF